MKKKVRRIIGITAALAAAAIVVYYGIEVALARANTQRIVDEYYDSGQVSLSIDTLSQRQVDILLAVEDPGFYAHHGVDLITPGAGWTTITQGLAKRFYFADFQQGIRKIKQTLCAWLALDPLVSKRTQLELYINIMYFGNGIYGLDNAAQYYFSKTVPELTENEYISLIGVLIDPEGLNAEDHPAENEERTARIVRLLSGDYVPEDVFDITYEGAN